MIFEKIRLAEQFEPLRESPAELWVYLPDTSPEIAARPRPCMVVFPGGGYRICSAREAEPAALAFLAQGYACFVLRYSVAPARWPAAFWEACAALALVRRNAKTWDLDASKLCVCGFSAGGHLAGSLACCREEWLPLRELNLCAEECRPDGAILCYPVVTGGDFRHAPSFERLLGADAPPALLREHSLEETVGPHTPPIFFWHAQDDLCVPVENTLLLAAALQKAHVPLELHLYPHGGHGLALCDARTAPAGSPALREPHVGSWFPLALEWLNIFLP